MRKPRSSAILGIDLGSTSTRAFLWCRETGREIPVESKTRPKRYGRFEAGDFSSSGYPFDEVDDDEKLYLGEDFDPDRQSISLKYAFYPLANASDELLQQYPHVRPLAEKKHDLAFRARLLRCLKCLFSSLHTRINDVCRAENLSIATIGLSIPAQWTLEFEDLYRSVIVEVFSHPRDDIFFHTETEALAHHLFKDHLSELQCSDVYDVMLFLDFGGHNMNGCIFNVLYGEDGVASFYRIDESFGAGGGSELWEFNVGELCMQHMEMEYHQRLSARAKQTILDTFCREKTNLGPNQDRPVRLHYTAGGKDWSFVLSPEKIKRCFDDALQGPFAVAAQRIEQISKLKDVKPRVIVSGGTARNETLQLHLAQLCRAAGLQEPLFTDTLEMRYETLKIAKGVAYAAGNHLTVGEFFKRGAAFGIQMLQSPTHGNSNPERNWDDTAAFLLDNHRHEEVVLFATGRDEFKIVCDPFRHATTDDDSLHYNKMYDVMYLGRLLRGWWRFRLTLIESAESMSLQLERWRRAASASRYTMVDSRQFPLYFDKGTNCIHIGSQDHSLDELNMNMYKVNNAPPSSGDCDGDGDGDGDGKDAADSIPDAEFWKRRKELWKSEMWCEPSEVVGRLFVGSQDGCVRVMGGKVNKPYSGAPRGVKPTGSVRNAPRVDPCKQPRRSPKK